MDEQKKNRRGKPLCDKNPVVHAQNSFSANDTEKEVHYTIRRERLALEQQIELLKFEVELYKERSSFYMGELTKCYRLLGNTQVVYIPMFWGFSR